MKCNQNGLWSQSKSLRKLSVFPHSTLLACMNEEVMHYIKKKQIILYHFLAL